jgi:translation initiation factor 1
MSRKNREGIVYSTNPEFNYSNGIQDSITTLPPNRQFLYVWLDSKSRKGKTVTLIKGFTGAARDLDNLAREMKRICNAGGSVKEGEIIIQGNFRDKVMAFLISEGYHVKKAGG